MIKILFLINTLGGGGAERVLVNLVNNMDRNKYQIKLETMYSDGVNLEELKPHIDYQCKKAVYFRGVSYLYRLIPSKALYRYFVGNEEYDIVVAYMHGAPTKVIAGRPNSVKSITWLHNGDTKGSNFFGFWLSKKIAFRSYRKFDAIVGVAKSVIDNFSLVTGISEKLYVLYNTNDTKKIEEMAAAQYTPSFTSHGLQICTIGRIDSQKGFDRLVSVAHRLVQEGYSFDISIVGDGKDRDLLERQICELDLEEYVHTLGFQNNPYSIIKKSDFFVSSSRFEGLSTVVSEAIILGKPVVSTDVSGIKEVLGENEYGLIVENSEAGIYEGIKLFLDNEDTRLHYGEKAKERSAFFSTVETVKKAENLFDEMCR